MRYWEGKLFHDGYTRNGKRVVSPDWSVRVQHAQRREAFALNTPNKSNAANQAREIFLCLKGAGWDETLKRFKPATTKTEITEVTVADFLREAQAIAGLKAKTFADYAKALRLIVASVFTIDGATYSTYRCKMTFDALVTWLRAKGVTPAKPMHELRKELGSMIANEHGIFAASRALRHTDVAITNQHYADRKHGVTVGLRLARANAANVAARAPINQSLALTVGKPESADG